MQTTNFKSFNYLENGEINFSILDTIKTTQILDKGVYQLTTTSDYSNPRVILKKIDDTENIDNNLDYYFRHKIQHLYNKFFNKNILANVNKLGYNHKLGILLYGKQGTGKSSILKHFYTDAIRNHNAIVFSFGQYENFKLMWEFIQSIRKIQKNPIIIFFDEFDEAFGRSEHLEGKLKMAMDGVDSIDNCLFLAATNYLDNIPKTLTERPSRFKYCIEVEGIQEESIILTFLKTSFGKIDMDIDFKKDMKELKGKTIDELKEYVLDKLMDIEKEKSPSKTVGFNK